MRTLEELEKYLDKLVAQNTDEIEECKTKIQEADAAAEKAHQDLLSAEAETNADDYNKAKDAIWSANNAKELYTKKKEQLETAPLISKMEYNSLLASITQAANDTHTALDAEAAQLLDELKGIADKATETTVKANSLLHTLQYKTYKDADKHILPNGNVLTQEQEYTNSNTVSTFYQNKVKDSFLVKGINEYGSLQDGRLTTNAKTIWKD